MCQRSLNILYKTYVGTNDCFYTSINNSTDCKPCQTFFCHDPAVESLYACCVVFDVVVTLVFSHPSIDTAAPLKNLFELELSAVYILPYQTTADNLSSLNIARIMGNIAHIIHDIARFVKSKELLIHDAYFATRAPTDLSLNRRIAV